MSAALLVRGFGTGDRTCSGWSNAIAAASASLKSAQRSGLSRGTAYRYPTRHWRCWLQAPGLTGALEQVEAKGSGI